MYQWIKPALFCLPPEVAHELVHYGGQWIAASAFGRALLSRCYALQPTHAIQQTYWGCRFNSPIGLAAGFDKNATLLPALQAVGFGFAEVGSVTARQSKGNPKPRLFRLPDDEALLNRMGLNNQGADRIVKRLRQMPANFPVGINVAKTHHPDILGPAALADFAHSLLTVSPYGGYVALNISCPNTREGKTFEEPAALDDLLQYLRQVEAAELPASHKKPWLIKLSPSLSAAQLTELAEVGHRYQVSGWILGNTRSDRAGLNTAEVALAKMGIGGISGKPLQHLARQSLQCLYKLKQQYQADWVLIAAGGIDSAEEAWRRITLGANLVQVYTGLVYHGPGLLKQIERGLQEKLILHGLDNITDAIGRSG